MTRPFLASRRPSIAAHRDDDRRPGRSITRLAALGLLALGLIVAGTLADPAALQAREAPQSFADLVERLLPGVVNISTTQTVAEADRTGDEEVDEFFREFFDRQRRENEPRRMTSLGSGFVIDATGYIVTNNHVIAEADEITVRFHDDSELKATIVGRDDKTDLALLKVESPKPLAALPWGTSDVLRIGDWVVAIGNPFGLGGTVTAGIVSARSRDINAGPYDDFIQTDASINRGNSGGPLFNLDGEVIGINTAIFSQSGGSVGIGFAIPSDLAKNVISQIREFGKPRRGWLGVRIQTVNEELAEGLRLEEPKGALVANVTEGGPADKAGIEQGDVVLLFDGKEVTAMRSLPRIVADTPIDKKVDVVVWRQGKQMKFQVMVGELPEEAEQASLSTEEPDAPPPAKEGKIAAIGLTLTEISPAMRERFNIDKATNGVVVTDIDPEGPAAEKELKPGDVIVEVDQHQVKTPGDVEKRIEDAKASGYRVVTMLIFSGGDFRWVAVRIDKG